LGVAVAALFVMLLTRHYVVAAIFAGLALLALAGWHAREPQE
jgi:hypothetical protein